MGWFSKAKEEVKDEILEHKKREEELKVAQSRAKAQQVAELYNALKKGCSTLDELKDRLATVRELDKNFEWSAEEKAIELSEKRLDHAKNLVQLAKDTNKEDLEKLKEFRKLSEKKLLEVKE